MIFFLLKLYAPRSLVDSVSVFTLVFFYYYSIIMASSKPGTSKQVNVLDSNFDEIVMKWYDSDNSDVEPEENEYIVSEHESASEQEVSDDDSNYKPCDETQKMDVSSGDSDGENSSNDELDSYHVGNRNEEKVKKYYYGKNRFKWSTKEPTRNIRTLAHNIVRLPAVRVVVDDNTNPKTFFSKLFSVPMYELIIEWTNKKLASMRTKYKRQNKPELVDVGVRELEALLGLLLYTAIFKSNDEDVRSIFATDGTGRDVFRAVMSKERFLILLTALRFDNADDREERKKENPVAAISELFDFFIENSRNSYTIGANACIDEMLVGFRGRCRFKMYIPSKPEKYGIKIMALTDARTQYLYNAYIYAGKDSDGRGLTMEERKLNKPTQSVIRLAKCLYNSNRNITADNWFSSVELAELLFANKLTFVGTLRKNKKEIPPELLPRKDRKQGDTLYGFTKNMTIISHTPKKNKAVIILSTMHHCKSTDEATGKTEINAFYNSTKGGVDAMDEKCAKYTCSRRTQRWPMAIFYKILDICSVNSFIMYSSFPNNDMSRFTFIKTLASQLVQNHMRDRLENACVNREIKGLIRRILCVSEPSVQEERLATRKYCYICPSRLKRKTAYACVTCKKPICLQCSRKCCINCCADAEDV